MVSLRESSVIVSIEELLRDAQVREERARREEEQRAREEQARREEAIRTAEEAERARLRAEEEAERRRAFEEEKRQIELQGAREAAARRAAFEAEAPFRAAQAAALREHELRLHALKHDVRQRRLARMLNLLGGAAVAGAVSAGVAVVRLRDTATAAQAQLRALREAQDEVERDRARIRGELDDARAEEARLHEAQRAADAAASMRVAPPRAASAVMQPAPRPAPTGAPRAKGHAAGSATPACVSGDPLCATIP